ncbi:MAG: hypothetical protein LR017_03180 [Candidatus Pacebacteria bacterium]|nr:hypothetical protein [Candidatus Paceibacterota bacterium]
MAGVYGYFLSRNHESDTEVTQAWDRGAFEIIAESYGGCAFAGCASYRMRADGTYTFIQEQQGDDLKYEDSISGKRLTALEQLVEGASLASLERSEATGRCPIEYDGTAYRFDIFVDGDTYYLDTCAHDLLSAPLILELRDYFEIFHITHVR